MKKIFYTFLLISPLLLISSCEEETQNQQEETQNQEEENAYIEYNGTRYLLKGSVDVYYSYYNPTLNPDFGGDSTLYIGFSAHSNVVSEVVDNDNFIATDGTFIVLEFLTQESDLFSVSSNYPLNNWYDTDDNWGCELLFAINYYTDDMGDETYDHLGCTGTCGFDNIVSGNAQLLINNDNTIEISAEGTIDNGDSFYIYYSGTNELYFEK